MTGGRLRPGILALGVGTLLAVAGCRSDVDVPSSDLVVDVFERQAQEEGLTRLETSGKRLFAQYCVTCHGENGAGDGQNAYNLDPAPPDFQGSLSSHPPSYWRQIIESGSGAVGRSSLCPPWGRTITREDVDALVAYLHTLTRPPEEANVSIAPESDGP